MDFLIEPALRISGFFPSLPRKNGIFHPIYPFFVYDSISSDKKRFENPRLYQESSPGNWNKIDVDYEDSVFIAPDSQGLYAFMLIDNEILLLPEFYRYLEDQNFWMYEVFQPGARLVRDPYHTLGYSITSDETIGVPIPKTKTDKNIAKELTKLDMNKIENLDTYISDHSVSSVQDQPINMELITDVPANKYTCIETEDGSIVNNTTFYVLRCEATPESIKESFLKAAKELHRLTGGKTKIDIDFNFPCRDGEYYTQCYIDVGDTRLYNAILGNSLDGGENVKLVPDPNWTAPKQKKKPTENTMAMKLFGDLLKDTDWADEDAEDIQQTAPLIRVECPPIIVLENGVDEDGNEVYFDVRPAFITPGLNVHQGEDPNRVRIHSRGYKFSERDYKEIVEMFERYARMMPEGFQHQLGRDGAIYVRFPSTSDCDFAMMMKMYFNYNDHLFVCKRARLDNTTNYGGGFRGNDHGRRRHWNTGGHSNRGGSSRRGGKLARPTVIISEK